MNDATVPGAKAEFPMPNIVSNNIDIFLFIFDDR